MPILERGQAARIPGQPAVSGIGVWDGGTVHGEAQFGQIDTGELLSSVAEIAAAGLTRRRTMDYHLFVHPNDEAAISKLKAVPGFDIATRMFMKFGIEQCCRGLYMANHIRLSPKQLPRIYNLLPPLCNILGIEVPELYLQMYPTPNAYTVGDKRNYIVMTSGVLDCLEGDDEIRSVLAHECGHIACRHVFYTTMVQMMLNFGSRYEVVQHIQEPLMLAYNFWARQSELSADRAAAVCLGGVVTPINTILRLAGGPFRYTRELDLEEYADQMMESEGLQKGGTWQKFLSDYVEMDEDHPFTSTRVKELLRWGNGPLFAKAIEVVQHKLLS